MSVRICSEVRFPEYFRELYREHTDLNSILFYDVPKYDDLERYNSIKLHIRTRPSTTCYPIAPSANKLYLKYWPNSITKTTIWIIKKGTSIPRSR